MKTNIGCSFWACKNSHCHLHLAGRVSKAGRDWENTVVNKRKGRLQMCCDWRLFAWDTGGWLTRRGAPYVIGWGTYLTFSGWSWDGREGRGGWGLGRSWHTLTKTWSFWTTVAEVVVWFSRLVIAEFYHHIWSGHCPFVYSVSQREGYGLWEGPPLPEWDGSGHIHASSSSLSLPGISGAACKDKANG